MEKAPSFNSDKFVCPHCNVVAQQYWFDASIASKKIMNIIHHTFLNYRQKIQDYHNFWTNMAEIKGTPTIFYNNRLLPDMVKLEDLSHREASPIRTVA